MPLDALHSLMVRWPENEPRPEVLFKHAGVEAVIGTAPDAKLPEGIASTYNDVVWPGIRTPGTSVDWVEETGSASRDPWIDSNAWVVVCQKALHPARPAILGYQPNKEAGLDASRMVPYESLEMGLMEARAMGGNWIAAPDERFRRQLAANDSAALAAWKNFGEFAAWLKANKALFGHPLFPTITMLIDEAESQEHANLMYRRGCSQKLVSGDAIPPPTPDCLCMVAAGVHDPAPAARPKILAHARAGAMVVVDAPGDKAWWRVPGMKPVKEQSDRIFYSLGKGQVVAYIDPVADPSEFALDVLDLVNYRNRPVRAWNAGTVVTTATRRGTQSIATLMNYGRQRVHDVQLRIRGNFKTATLHTPGAPEKPLEAKRREAMTEVFLPELGRMGAVVFG